jgi:DNA-binding response OmpR family regulator
MRQRKSDVSLSAPPASAVSQTLYVERSSALNREPGRKILSISAASEDHDSLRRILNDPGWRITPAFSCQQGIACLCRDRMAVILCDCHLPDGTWRDILSHIAELPEPPVVIVTARTANANSNLRAEVRALGGYDVLTKPFSPEEVVHVLIAAWRNRAVSAEVPIPA